MQGVSALGYYSCRGHNTNLFVDVKVNQAHVDIFYLRVH
ncbi:MAG: hypothetical protein BWY74_01079 [Firmicutes bacterium ADurb.Bin419]|nr:MAG: hypothetical protein BWY74_01079 [Firmicutes bacterium ADurb.Bin419]